MQQRLSYQVRRNVGVKCQYYFVFYVVVCFFDGKKIVSMDKYFKEVLLRVVMGGDIWSKGQVVFLFKIRIIKKIGIMVIFFMLVFDMIDKLEKNRMRYRKYLLFFVVGN